MCFLRHLSAEEADGDLAHWRCRSGDRFVAVGLDSSEAGHPPGRLQGRVREAREHRFHGWRTPAKKGRRNTSGRPWTY